MRGKFVFIRLLAISLVLGVVLCGHTVLAASLAQIIEGAKKEGTVSAKLVSSLNPKSIPRLEREIREKFGVNLNIKLTPSSGWDKEIYQAMMEYKAGAVASYDLSTFGSEIVVPGLKAGIFEKVDWASLVPKEMPPDAMVRLPRYGDIGLTYYTSSTGLLYNPEKISLSQVPKTLNDLADPKWKGKVGIHRYANIWATDAFILGKPKVLSVLRAILKNGVIQGRFADIHNRYMLGEIWIGMVEDERFRIARGNGAPAAWQPYEYVLEKNRPLLIQKGAQHPNAAKLLAIYLASLQGAKFMWEESGTANACYPGNFAEEIRIQAKKQGMRVLSMEKLNDLMDFYDSPDFEKWQAEITLILQTAN